MSKKKKENVLFGKKIQQYFRIWHIYLYLTVDIDTNCWHQNGIVGNIKFNVELNRLSSAIY